MAKKSKSGKSNAVPSKKSKPTKSKNSAPPTVKTEPPTTTALTIVQPIKRTYHPNEAVFSIHKRHKKNELPELSVRLSGKELAQVPIPESGELREEVDIILRMLIRRMAELMGECKSKGDVPAATTRIQPALKLLRLVGEAYL